MNQNELKFENNINIDENEILDISDEYLFGKDSNKEYRTESLSSLKQFFKEIGEYKLLSIDEEFEITKRINDIEIEKVAYENKINNNEEISKDLYEYLNKLTIEENNLRNKLINANYRLVVSIAKKYQNKRIDFMDLIEEGIIGLIKSTYKYDYKLGYRFSTYAVNWIKQSISRSIINNSRMIRIPVHVIESMNRINQEEEKFLKNNNRVPSLKELSSLLNINEKKIIDIKNSFYQIKYLDETINQDADKTIEETLTDDNSNNPENAYDNVDLKNEMDKVLKTLSEKEEYVIKYRYGLTGESKTLEEIGKEMKITKERVRQIEQNALKKLRSPERIKDLMCFV